MARALIGYTGFVGGNLRQQFEFDDLYNSSNIEDIRGRAYDVVYCAGAPGAKWRANAEPEKDRASIDRLQESLASVRIGHVVLLSTIDVYPEPRAVDESTPIDASQLAPYGGNRLALERFVQERFEATVVRLPALFGPGLRKNVVYDFMHNNQLEKISPLSEFQFYDLRRLASDVDRVRALQLPVVNFATEPVLVGELAREAFGFEFTNPHGPPPQVYDMRSLHAAALGGADGYLADRATTLTRLADYVRSTGWRAG